LTFIKLDRVGKKRGKKWVLRDISLEVGSGELAVIYGPSGSGKSTLLRCINRLSEVSAGKVFVNRKNITDYDPPELRRTVGMVFQFPNVFSGTVRENIEYGLNIWNVKPGGRTLQALKDAGLDRSFLKRDAEKLSGGEQQRVCLARSLAVGPKALMLDEPTSSLDTKVTRKIEETVGELKDRLGLSILWVTHDAEQARRIADKVIVLDEGRLVSSASASEFQWGELLG